MKKVFKVLMFVVALSSIALVFTGCNVVDEVNKLVDQTVCKHQYEIVDETASTCTEAGIITKVCTLCEKEVQEEKSFASHQLVTIAGKSATCEETGLTDSTKCLVCEKVITPAAVIPAIGHKNEVVPGVEATCLVAGITDGSKCSVCDKTLIEQKEIAALGHNPQFIDAKEPTCVTDGYTSGARCLNCGEIYSGCEPIPATGSHDDLEYGETCEECGETFNLESIVAGDYETAELTVGETITSGSVFRIAKEASAEFNISGISNATLFIGDSSLFNYVGYSENNSIQDGLVIRPNYDVSTGSFTSLLTEEGLSYTTGLDVYTDGTYIYVCFYGETFDVDIDAFYSLHELNASDFTSFSLSSFTYASKSGDVVRLVY